MGVFFEEDAANNEIKKRVIIDEQEPVLVKSLLDHHLVHNKLQANIALIIISIIFFALSFLFFKISGERGVGEISDFTTTPAAQ